MKATGTIQTSNGCWETPNGNATNESGFTGLPVGYRSDTGSFTSIGNFNLLWSSLENNITNSWYHYLRKLDGFLLRDLANKKSGFSVRLIKDEITTTTTTSTSSSTTTTTTTIS
jgi:uncharacterized protein (TIGR02145 family)